MSNQKLATASAAGVMGILSGIFMALTGALFLGFGDTFTKKLAPLLGSNLAIFAGILNMIFAVIYFIGGYLVYSFRYRIGGILILVVSILGIFSGGGFYISTLWGLGAGMIALICPSLEAKILQSQKGS